MNRLALGPKDVQRDLVFADNLVRDAHVSRYIFLVRALDMTKSEPSSFRLFL